MKKQRLQAVVIAALMTFPIGWHRSLFALEGDQGSNAPLKMPKEAQRIQLTAEGNNTFDNGVITAEKNVELLYGETSLYADKVVYDTVTGWARAEGRVRIYGEGGVLWAGEKINYNFKTGEVDADYFRFVNYPFVGASRRISTVMNATQTNYVGQFDMLSTENLRAPGFKIKTRTIIYDPGERRYELEDATVYADDVPLMWVPKLVYDPGSSDFGAEGRPGYSSDWGAFLLTSYGFRITEAVRAKVHLDLRSERGVGGGADLKWIYGKRKGTTDEGEYGQGMASAYYIHDQKPDRSDRKNTDPSRYRFKVEQRAYFTQEKDVYANLVFNKLSDRLFERDFFESDYRRESQPDNFVEVVKYDPNFTASILTRQQINDFFETVEREPEVIWEIKRQNVLPGTALEYNGQNSIVQFDRKFSNEHADDPKDYNAVRFDTFHQLLYPKQYFGWLNVTPRMGWRGTYYTDSFGRDDRLPFQDENTYGSGDGNGVFRSIFHTGLEMSFKLSRTWDWKRPEWGIDRFRHVVEPFINFSYIPNPSISPDRIMGFDDRLRSTRLQPLDFPQYNSIDSIDNQLVTRVGFRQKWQTKRDNRNWTLLEWATYTDVDFEGQYYNDNRTANLYNEVEFRPVPWLTFRAFASSGLYRNSFNEYNTQLSWQIARPLELTLGTRYINNADNLFPNSNQYSWGLFYRLNESWSFGTRHVLEAETSTLEFQEYSIYRDFTSWRMALSGQVRDHEGSEDEYAIYLSFTLKAFPEANIPFSYRGDGSEPFGD